MKNTTLISIFIFALVLVAAATGLFYKTSGAPFQYSTVRGQQATIMGSGLYRYDPVSLVSEGVIWDGINLFIGLPLFAAAIILSQRNSLRGRLFLAGLLFYFFYVYLMLMTMDAFNFLFLDYVAIFALSAVAFFVNLQKIDIALLPEQVSNKFPRHWFIAFSFTFSAVLLFLWLGRILPIMTSGQFPPELAGLTTMTTQGFDLGMLVPLGISTGVQLLRRSPLAYLLSGILLSFGLLMFITLPAWIVIPLIQNGSINLMEASPFMILCLIGIAFFVLFFRSVKQSGSSALN
ncbi:MAG: hypothetical protein P4L50_27020 [Anaerolineaceae bacterium]|nr:hypothetical protein [Anaerolineaceae bacterium]